MSKELLSKSVGLIVGKKNYILLRKGEALPISERHLDMGSNGGEIVIQVTEGDSDIPSEVHILGRGVLRVPKLEKQQRLIVTLSADENGQIRLYIKDTASGKDREDFFSPDHEKASSSVKEAVSEDKEEENSSEAASKEDSTDETAEKEESTEYADKESGKEPEKSKDETSLASRMDKPAGRRVNPEIEDKFSQKHLIGLTDVKLKLSAMYNTLLMSDDLRRSGGSDVEMLTPWNFFIGGGSGSGKHSIARIISELLYDNSMTDRREPVITNAISIDPSKPGEFFEELAAEGRAVIIENTELLISDDENGKDNTKLWLLISAILEAANERQNCFYIFLGEKEAMEKQIQNSARLSRAVTYIGIPPYDAKDLKKIALRFIKGVGFRLDPDAEDAFERAVRNESILPKFAGANSLKVLIRDATERKGDRYVNGAQDKVLIANDFDDSKNGSETLEDILKELDEMVGLSNVKQEIRDIIDNVKFDKKFSGAGDEAPSRSLHMMFLGNPGTGKTQTARLVGRIYGKLGLLPKPDLFVEADRSAFIGQYMGHSEKATRDLIESAMGGVLFIDEAHRIVSGDQDEYGKQAFGILIKMMEDYRDRIMVIFAGYDNMEQILAKYDPGISSRVPTRLHFDDYTHEELLAIFEAKLRKNVFPLVLDGDAKKEAAALIRERSTMPNFGNARGVLNIAGEVVKAVKKRIENDDSISLEKINEGTYKPVTVIKEDILASGKREIKGPTLEDYKLELDQLIGLERIKEEVRVMEDRILVEQTKIRLGGTPSESFYLHALFYGNAGTGKTTVAELIGKIYNKMGVLPAGDKFVTATRGDLVAEYEGQTAIKTRQLVESAIGGVLFIDEAYALCTGPGDAFGMEALNTLLTLATDYRDRLMIILAGYEGPIKRLMALNQGLERRFPNQFHFEDYSQDELYAIFCHKLRKNGKELEEGADDIIKEVIRKRSMRNGFGNAGGIDNIMNNLISAQAVRLGPMMNSEELTLELFKKITLEDAKSLLTAGRE